MRSSRGSASSRRTAGSSIGWVIMVAATPRAVAVSSTRSQRLTGPYPLLRGIAEGVEDGDLGVRLERCCVAEGVRLIGERTDRRPLHGGPWPECFGGNSVRASAPVARPSGEFVDVSGIVTQQFLGSPHNTKDEHSADHVGHREIRALAPGGVAEIVDYPIGQRCVSEGLPIGATNRDGSGQRTSRLIGGDGRPEAHPSDEIRG